MTADKTYPKHLRRVVDFCCDRVSGCGHHIDGHSYGNDCQVPGCDCRSWRDHTFCDHRQLDAADPLVEVERYRDTLEDLAKDCEAFPEDHRWAAIMTATAVRVRLILAGERP